MSNDDGCPIHGVHYRIVGGEKICPRCDSGAGWGE